MTLQEYICSFIILIRAECYVVALPFPEELPLNLPHCLNSRKQSVLDKARAILYPHRFKGP